MAKGGGGAGLGPMRRGSGQAAAWLLCCGGSVFAAAGDCPAATSSAEVWIGPWALAVRPYEDVPDGAQASVPCRAAHDGYNGAIQLQCSGGELAADASACRRARCVGPGRFVRRSPTLDFLALPLGDLPADLGSPLWSDFARTEDQRLLAAPVFARQALEINASGGVRTFGDDLDQTPLKYHTTVTSPGPPVAYGLPFFADQVVKIDAGSSTVTTVGPSFGVGLSKWYGGAFAAGSVWGMPYGHGHVLRVDVATDSVSLVGADLGAFGAGKWWEAICVGDLVLGIPHGASTLLLVDAAAAAVSTFGGPFGDAAAKWFGAIAVPGTGLVYVVPHVYGWVLKVDVHGVSATLVGPDFGQDEAKWHGAVLAGDGAIFGIPYGASEVLRIDPDTDDVSTFGALPAGPRKWSWGVLASDGSILGVPGERSDILKIDPAAATVTLENVTVDGLPTGASKWNGAAVGLDGAVYAAPGAMPAALRIGLPACLEPPPRVEENCALGQPCTVTVRGDHVRAPQNRLWVLEAGHCAHVSAVGAHGFEGWTNPVAADAAGAGATTFFLGTAVAAAPLLVGQYRLCWGDDPADSTDFFDQDVGLLSVSGPWPLSESTTCTLGRVCSVDLVGRDLLPTDQVAVLEVPDHGEPTNLASFPGMTNPTNGTTPSLFLFGTPAAGQPGGYALFWGRSPFDFWSVQLGSFMLHGPSFFGDRTYSLGEPATLTLLGAGLQLTDGLVLVASPLGCGSAGNQTHRSRVSGWCTAATGVCNPSDIGAGGESSVYVLGEASAAVDVGHIPRFALCWESGAARDGEDPPQFVVALGVLTLVGPVVPSSGLRLWTCRVAVGCAVAVRGYGLGAADSLLAVVADGNCRAAGGQAYGAGSAGELADLGIAANPVGVFNVSFPASSEHDEGGAAAEQAETELVFDLGAPQRGATAGGPPLRLCWERPGAEGHAAVEVGLLVLLENDCAAPVVADATNPPCSAGGVVVPHLGACSTRCEEGFDASVASLECAAGVLSPATFECYKRCLVPPVVAGAGGAQEQCSDMPHDSVCSPDCADGHVPSGDFVCRDGFWDHRPNPNLSGDLLYAVPRCYQPCGKTEFPSVAGTTTDVCPGHSGSVPHGGTCPTNCDADHTAFSADGSRSLGESQCRDGGFEPAAFVCRRRCDAPVVAHAVNLQTCQGTPHGQGCELQCAYGHRKTGDLYCQDGEFSPAECKRPCDLSAQWPQGLPNAHGQMCSGVAEDLLLPHGSTCVPACLLGYSNSDEAAYPTCDDGVLLPAAVECHADCTTPPIQGLIPGAQDLSVVCSGLRHGESCPLLCEEGFTSFGRIDCVHGEFVAGTCQRNCMALPAISGSANVDHCYGTGHGETCEVRCREGFAWQGDARCSDGAWEALELCSSPCHAGDAPGPQAHAPAVLCAEGEVIMHGEACTFRCGEGYTTDAVAQCSNGTLEPSTYACTAVASYACGPASDVPGISPADATACAGTGHNAWCMVFCTDGFERTADLLCMHGQWNEPCSDLRPQCGPPPAIPHGRPSNECPFLVGSFCPVVCDAGFAPGTVTGFTCGADLGWSADVSCIRTTCGLPTPPAHGSMTCNGVAEASSCQVACDEGYGPGGELVCSQDGDGVWTWVTYTSAGAEGGALCLPLPCADVPYVPGVSLHSCGSTPHASTCAAFSCRDSLVPTGTYRCRNGLFVELPSCLPASASGVASVPAVLFQLKVELVAEWGDLPPSDSWGEVASDLVALALSRALLQEGDPGEVLLLGWSANEVASEPAEDQLLVGAGGGAPRSLRSPRFSLRAAPRRLAGAGVGLEILAAVAAEAAPGSGVVQDAGSDADAFAEAMAGRVAALTPSVLAFFVTNEPKLIGYGGEVDLVFASVGLPRRTRLDRPAPTTTPPATRTATRTTRPPATTTTTTRTTLYEPEVSAFERFVTESRHAIVAGVAFLCLVSTVIVCLVIRRRNGRLMKTAKDEPSYTRRRKKNLVKAPKRGSCVMNKADLHTVVQEELSKLKEEQALKKAKLCREAPPAGRRNSQKHQDAQEALRAQVMAAVQVGNIAHAHTRQVVVKHEVPLYDQLRQANRPEHLAYFIRSQAQKDKPGTEVPEDWVRLSTEGEPQNADWESLRITIRATRRASVLEKRESTKKEAAEKAESESEHSDTRSEGVQSDARSDEMQSDAARQDSHQEDAQSEHGAMAGVLQLPAHLRRKAGPAITDSPMEMRDAEAKPEAEGEEDRPEDGNQGAAPDKEPDDREACASEVAEAEGEGAVPAAHADERRVYVSEDVEVHDVHGAQQGQEEDEEEEEEDDDTDSEDSDQPKIRKRWCKKKKAASGRKANPHCMHHFAYRSHVTVDAAEERLPNFHRVIERAEDDDLTRTGRRLDSKMSSSSASSYGSKSSHRKRARDHRKTWEFDTFPVTLAPALHDARRRSDPVMR